MGLLRLAPILLLLIALAISLVTDLRSRRIPDVVTLPALVLSLGLKAAAGEGVSGLAGAALALAPFLLVCVLGGMGMGDVKLMAVVGAALGLPRAVEAVALVAVAGGIQAAVLVIGKGALRQTAGRILMRGPAPAGLTLPYGVAIFAGSSVAAFRALLGLGLALCLLWPYPALAEERVELGVGAEEVLSVPGGIARIAVGNPQVASARPVGTDQVLVTGSHEGRTTLLVWKAGGGRISWTLQVRRISAADTLSEIRALLGDREGLILRTVGDRIFLDGEAYTADDLRRVDQIVEMYPGVKSLVRISAAARKILARNLTESFAQAGLPQVRASVVGTTLVLEGSVGSEADLHKAEILSRSAGEKVENLVSVGVKPLVMSEVRFFEIRQADALSMGIRWPLEITGSLTATGSYDVVQDIPTLQLAGTGNTDFSFRFVQDAGVARLLAEPRLLCASGGEASFLAGGEVPIPAITAQAASVVYKPYGIILKLRPNADGAGNVSADIEAEVSEVDESVAVAIGPDHSVPGFRNRRVKTQVTVKDGETIVLSGVLSKDEQKSVSKTPGLGHIPILGELFKQRTLQQTDRDLLIVVTPHLVTPGSDRIRGILRDMKSRFEDAGTKVHAGVLD